MIVLVVIIVGLVLVAILGIIAAIAIPNLLTATQRSKQKRTMADMRSIATAIEAYAVDSNIYPSAETVSELEPILTPTYIRELPQVDGWGEPYRYECWTSSGDSSDPCDSYSLASGGRDRTFESADYASTITGSTDNNFDCDIVYANGFFVRYPGGTQ
ncbi:MAG TPA: type II secretion system protein GspG [Thermoanaerobaculia bacterium]|nr:type II secretion system protein GspG [Thermoanaerobaculia bacterium]